jgi:hypothetical protein
MVDRSDRERERVSLVGRKEHQVTGIARVVAASLAMAALIVQATPAAALYQGANTTYNDTRFGCSYSRFYASSSWGPYSQFTRHTNPYGDCNTTQTQVVAFVGSTVANGTTVGGLSTGTTYTSNYFNSGYSLLGANWFRDARFMQSQRFSTSILG